MWMSPKKIGRGVQAKENIDLGSSKKQPALVSMYKAYEVGRKLYTNLSG